MLSDNQFQAYLDEWGTAMTEQGYVRLTLHEVPPSPLYTWIERRYCMTYNNEAIDLTSGQAARLHYWFELQRQRLGRKYEGPSTIQALTTPSLP